MAKGRKINTWKWSKAGVAAIEIPVYLFTARDGAQHFEVDLQSLQIFEKDANIQALKKRVFATLEGRHTVTWEPYFLVEYKGDHSLYTPYTGRLSGSFNVFSQPSGGVIDEYAADEKFEDAREGGSPSQFHAAMEFTLKVEEVELGTYPNGEKCWRRYGSYTSQNGWPHEINSKSGKYFHWSDCDQLAGIKATKENRLALRQLFKAFALMDVKLRELLAQDKLQASLEKIMLNTGAGVLMLPAPGEPPKKEKKDDRDQPRKSRKGRAE